MEKEKKILELFTTSFFEKVLSSQEEQTSEIVVDDVETKIATNFGDNFGSVLYRSTVKFNGDKEVTMITKTMDNDSDNFDQFNTEIKMYTKVLPKINKILNENLCPRLIYQTVTPVPERFGEDLIESEFVALKAFLDLNTSEKFIRLLGKFHAATMHLQSKMDFTTFCEPYMLDDEFLTGQIVPGIKIIATELEEVGLPIVSEKLRDLLSTFPVDIKSVFQPKQNGPLFVLNHCDVQFKNFMLHHPSGMVKFIDFQNCTWNTAAIDLHYFLYLVADEQARNCEDALLESYHHELSVTLVNIGYELEIPSLDNVKLEMEQYKILRILLIYEMLWQYVDYSSVDPTDVFGQGTDPFAIQKMMVKNERYQNVMKNEMNKYFE